MDRTSFDMDGVGKTFLGFRFQIGKVEGELEGFHTTFSIPVDLLILIS